MKIFSKVSTKMLAFIGVSVVAAFSWTAQAQAQQNVDECLDACGEEADIVAETVMTSILELIPSLCGGYSEYPGAEEECAASIESAAGPAAEAAASDAMSECMDECMADGESSPCGDVF